MRILQVALGFYPALSWGGPVKVVHQNGLELVRRGHQVTVYCTNLLNKYENIANGTFESSVDGMRVVYFNTWRLKHWPGTLGPFWLPDLSSCLEREIASFDIAHINGYRCPMFLCVAQAARAAGVPVVTQPHGTLPVIENSFRLKRLYDRLWGRKELEPVAALIALQRDEMRQALAHGVPAEAIHIVPNGIALAERAKFPAPGAFRTTLGLPPPAKLILFLARLNPKKGAVMLVEAFARLHAPDTHLVIAGPDDGDLAAVQQRVAELGLRHRVTFTGLLEGSQVYGALQDADVFVLPCRSDTFPFAIVEACLAETPMVITDRCEIAEMLRGRVADVAPYDPVEFACALDGLLHDEAKRVRYRRNCRELVEQAFSVAAVVDRLEEIYDKVASPTQPRRTRHALP